MYQVRPVHRIARTSTRPRPRAALLNAPPAQVCESVQVSTSPGSASAFSAITWWQMPCRPTSKKRSMPNCWANARARRPLSASSSEGAGTAWSMMIAVRSGSAICRGVVQRWNCRSIRTFMSTLHTTVSPGATWSAPAARARIFSIIVMPMSGSSSVGRRSGEPVALVQRPPPAPARRPRRGRRGRSAPRAAGLPSRCSAVAMASAAAKTSAPGWIAMRYPRRVSTSSSTSGDMPPATLLNSNGAPTVAAIRSTSAGDCGASTKTTSAPSDSYRRARASASSRPSGPRASVRATITVPSRRASSAERSEATNCSVSTTCFSAMCPQRLGNVWSSNCTAAAPARS